MSGLIRMETISIKDKIILYGLGKHVHDGCIHISGFQFDRLVKDLDTFQRDGWVGCCTENGELGQVGNVGNHHSLGDLTL